jgi:hypothetical protein
MAKSVLPQSARQEGVKYEVPQKGVLAYDARQPLDPSQVCIGVGLNCGERWWRAGRLFGILLPFGDKYNQVTKPVSSSFSRESIAATPESGSHLCF